MLTYQLNTPSLPRREEGYKNMQYLSANVAEIFLLKLLHVDNIKMIICNLKAVYG